MTNATELELATLLVAAEREVDAWDINDSPDAMQFVAHVESYNPSGVVQ